MNNNMLIITIAALALVALLSIFVFILAFKLISNRKSIRNEEPTDSNTHAPPFKPTTATSAQLPSLAPYETLNCSIHKDLPAQGLCIICSDSFCHTCLKTHNNLAFCKLHLEVYLTNNWKDIISVKTKPQSPEEGHYLYDFKEYLWSKKIPTLIQTKYKIDIQLDEIESYVTLIGREDDYDSLKEEESLFRSSTSINQ